MKGLRDMLAAWLGQAPEMPRTDAAACARALAAVGVKKRAEARSRRVWAHIAALKASPDFPGNEQVRF